MRARWPQPHTQRGFSMIELLVSLVVLAIGLLGLAALQTTALRNNQSSYFTTIATSQIQSMADRMRANPSGLSDGDYNSISGIPSDPGCNPCTPAQHAQRDAYQWNTDNRNLLPSGQGTVTANGSTYTITVMWDNDRTGATGTKCGNNTAVDLTCLQMSLRL